MRHAVGFFVLMLAAAACERKPQAVWSVSEGLEAPESAYVEPSTNLIYVSNISGSPAEKDGKGFISRVTLEGKVRELQWVSGLNAPKGMRSRGDELYVADIDQLLVISIAKAKVIKRIPIPGAEFLNDVAVDEGGAVYVSDTMAGKIFKIPASGKPEVFLAGDILESPNGLYIAGNKLYVASWGPIADPATFKSKTPGRLLEFDLATQAQAIRTPIPFGNLDGLEPDGQGGWYVSDWMAGKLFQVGPRGQIVTLLEGFKGSADIGRAGDMLIIPQMMTNSLDAFRLK